MGDIGNKGRQDGKAGIPSNKGTQEGRPCETRPRESDNTIQDRRSCGQTMGDKRRQALGNRTQAHIYIYYIYREDNGRHWVIPSKTRAHKSGDYGRQAEARPREGGRTIQHRHICGEKKRDKGRQDLGKAVTQDRYTYGAHMREDNGKQGRTSGGQGGQDLGKADAPSNKGK